MQVRAKDLGKKLAIEKELDLTKYECIGEGLFNMLGTFIKNPDELNFRFKGFGDFYFAYDKSYTKLKDYIKYSDKELLNMDSRITEFKRLLRLVVLYLKFKDEKNEFRKNKVIPHLIKTYGTTDQETNRYIERLNNLINLHEYHKEEFHNLQYPEVYKSPYQECYLQLRKEGIIE